MTKPRKLPEMSWVIAKRNSTPPKFSFDPFGIATACGRTRWIFGRTGRTACTTNSNPRVGHSIGSHLRTCEKIRKRRTRARKAVWQGAREGASPQRAVTERATRPDGLSCSRPQGCGSFWLDLRCSGGTADRRETACRRQPAGRCKASATPLRVLPPPSRLDQAKNPAATRHFVIFSQVLNESADNFAANFPDANLQNNTSEDGDG